jgi:hypothetical protein
MRSVRLQMRPTARSAALFYVAAALCAVVATLGSDVVSTVAVTGGSARAAATEHLNYALRSPIGTALLFLPFIAAAWLGASVAGKQKSYAALLVFVPTLVLLLALYFSGYYGSQQALLEHKWTAASLSVGLLPFQSIAVLLIGLILRWWVTRSRSTSGA